VSRWWAEPLRIGLGAARVDCVRQGLGRGAPLGLWPRRRVLARGSAGFAPRPPEPAWRGALDALDQALDGALDGTAARGEAAHVRLSNRWVRYAVLPWNAAVSGSAELEALARLRFEQRHGSAVAQWTVRCGDGGWGRPLLACAIDTALLDGLRERLDARGIALASLQPLLMACFNDWRRRLAPDAALAIVEGDRLTLAAFEQAGFVEVSSRRCGADLQATVEQELATLPLAARPGAIEVALIGDDAPGPALREGEGDPALRLLGRRELALCGA